MVKLVFSALLAKKVIKIGLICRKKKRKYKNFQQKQRKV